LTGLLIYIDVGYGNYLLTAPVERNQRQLWKEESEKQRATDSSEEKIEVPELLSPANTLTNPFATKSKRIEL
jgi:hypothetical protein